MTEQLVQNPQELLPEVEPRPFIFDLQRHKDGPGSYFTPAASLRITGELRTSGLLLALPAEELKHLLFLLTFVGPNGHCLPSVPELSQAMRVSQAKTRARMRKLTQFHWQERPVVIEVKRENGLDAFSPAPHLMAMCEREVLPNEAPPPTESSDAPIRTADRENVIAFSRENYARPRAEVEQMIAEQMGWDKEDPTADIRRQLMSVGILAEQATYLAAHFPLEEIQQQLQWLPYRKAKNPPAFLVAAIEGNYEAPLALRRGELPKVPDPNPPINS